MHVYIIIHVCIYIGVIQDYIMLLSQKNLDVLDPKCQPKRSSYGLPEDKFIFACFNQLYKMDPDIFNTWLVECFCWHNL